MKYLAVPPDTKGSFKRRVCKDGVISFLPATISAKMKKELKRLEKIEKEGEFVSLEESMKAALEMAEKEKKKMPISCQQGTPGGSVPE